MCLCQVDQSKQRRHIYGSDAEICELPVGGTERRSCQKASVFSEDAVTCTLKMHMPCDGDGGDTLSRAAASHTHRIHSSNLTFSQYDMKIVVYKMS